MQEIERLKRYIENAVKSAETDFERLVFLGSLRDAYTGRYLHEGLSGIALAGEVHSTLERSHRLLFASVLRLPVLNLSRELRSHFRKCSEPERETSMRWLDLEPFRDLIPANCPSPLRAIFISQVRTALEILCRAPHWEELAVQDASPPPQPGQQFQLHWIN
jgi:hypothetical protein